MTKQTPTDDNDAADALQAFTDAMQHGLDTLQRNAEQDRQLDRIERTKVHRSQREYFRARLWSRPALTRAIHTPLLNKPPQSRTTPAPALGDSHGRHLQHAADAEADRAQQKELLIALDAWDRALRRDECGAWCIIGKNGTILTWGDGETSWVIYMVCRRPVAGTRRKTAQLSARSRWTATRTAPYGSTNCRPPSRPTSSGTCSASASALNSAPRR